MVELDQDQDAPCVTAAFWSDDGWWLTAGESWPDVMDNGARDVLRPALARLDRALTLAQEILPLSDRQLEAVRTLYLRRMAVAPARLRIAVADLAGLRPEGLSAADAALELLGDRYPINDADKREIRALPLFGSGSEEVSRELLSNIGIDVM